MALENLKSTQITNRDAVPPVLNNATTDGGALRADAAVITPSDSASVSSTFRMVSVPSNARVHRVIFAAGAMTAGAFDIGVYKSTRDGGAVVDADFFASAVNCSAAVALTDVTNESTEYSVTEQTQPLWQALGQTEDPKSEYNITLTCTTQVTTGAAAVLKAEYVV